MKKSFLIFLITAMVAAAPIQSFAAEAGTKPNPDIGFEQEEPEKLPENSLEQTDKKTRELQRWYRSLSKEQKEFAKTQFELQESQQLLEQGEKDRKETEELKNYLQKNLSKSQYTYLENGIGTLKVGVPSAKYMAKVESLVNSYAEKKQLSVSVDYELCRYSKKELEKAKSEIEKNSEFTKLEQNAPIPIKITKGYLEFYCVKGKTKGFDNWLKKSEYQDMIVVKENQKPLNTDTAGL